jgi:hypothetical protein
MYAKHNAKPPTALQKATQKIRALEWRESQIANGLCVACAERATHGIRCEMHWLWQVAYNHGLRPHMVGARMLKEIWDSQGGLCALTGVRLVPGAKHASLDHKIPLSAGGTNSRENLHWVAFGVNASKADLSLDEFVAMCRAVVEHADRKVVHLRKVEDK